MKKILFICSTLVAVVLTSCCCNQKEAAPVKKEMALQLYSARTLIGDSAKYAQNHESVFKALAEYGYTGVEAANYKNGKFYGVSPEQFKADVEAAGLEVISSHTTYTLSQEQLESGDYSVAMPWWDECIAAHKAAGMKYIVIPSCRLPKTIKGLETLCAYFNEVGKKVNEAGMKFGYHSHSFEFVKVEDVMAYDYMVEHTNPAYVFFQMDVYWAVMAKVSPVEYFKKYPGRFTLLHIKDNKEIGQSGMVGFDAIFKNFDSAGTAEYVVEMEGSSSGDILAGLKESAEYLLKADYVKPSYK